MEFWLHELLVLVKAEQGKAYKADTKDSDAKLSPNAFKKPLHKNRCSQNENLHTTGGVLPYLGGSDNGKSCDFGNGQKGKAMINYPCEKRKEFPEAVSCYCKVFRI